MPIKQLEVVTWRKRSRWPNGGAETQEVKFKPDGIDCDGCWSERISGWCRKMCRIGLGLNSEKSKPALTAVSTPAKNFEFLANEPAAKQNLTSIQKTLQP